MRGLNPDRNPYVQGSIRSLAGVQLYGLVRAIFLILK